MAKMTLLEITQDIANDIETDEINSINDTVESIQIAQIVRTTYEELISTRNWPHLKRTFQLEAPAVPAATPTHLKFPDLVKETIAVYYNKRRLTDTKDKYLIMVWEEPEEFLRRTNARNSSETNVDVITDFGGVSLYIRNDKQPEFFTSFDDEHVVFDSYDNEVDLTELDITKTQILGFFEPVWTQADSFIPDLPSEAFSGLLAEAKSTAFIVLKQVPNPKAEQIASRNHKYLSRKAWKIKGGVRYPNFGRRVRAAFTNRNPLIDKNN